MIATNAFAFMMVIVSFVGFVVVDLKEVYWTRVLSNSLGIGLWGIYMALSFFLYIRSKHQSAERLLAYVRNTSWLVLVFSILTGIVSALGSISSCGRGWVFFFFYYHVSGLLGAAGSMIVWFGVPGAIRSKIHGDLGGSRHLRPVRKRAVGIVVFLTVICPWSGMWLFYWGLVHADVDERQYPAATTSPYKLPFESGVSVFLVQGNNGGLSHFDEANLFAWDFMAACGTPVVAARGGEVIGVEDKLTGNHFTGQSKNNYIEIIHDDFTVAGYYHIQKGSSMVHDRDRVEQGQPIALVGNVGMSAVPHLHFGVDEAPYLTTPVSFQDVTKHSGIPRSLRFYTSGNEPYRDIRDN